MFWGLISLGVMAARQIYHDVRIERNDQKARENPNWYGTFYSCDGREKWASTCTPVTKYYENGDLYLKDLRTKKVYNLSQLAFEQTKEENIRKAKEQNKTVIKYCGCERYRGTNEVQGARYYDIETGKLLVARRIEFADTFWMKDVFVSVEDGKIIRATDSQRMFDEGKDPKGKSRYMYGVWCYINPEDTKKLVDRYNNDLEYRSRCKEREI